MRFSVSAIYSVIFLLIRIAGYTVCISENLNAALQHNTAIPSHHDKWKAVKITYTKNFPYGWSSRTDTQGCTKVSALSGNKKKIVQLQCNESIILLRPGNIVDQWNHFQKKNGYLLFTMKELGLVNIHAHMVTVMLPRSMASGMNSSGIPAGIITGIFLKHTLDVRQYTLENTKSHIRSTLTVTPEHPVYVNNKKAFIPIDSVTSHDQLSSKNVHLLCQEPGLCGIPYHPGGPTGVYNIEVHKKHTYFVGSEYTLAHNICGMTAQDVYLHLTKKNRVSEKSLGIGVRLEGEEGQEESASLSLQHIFLKIRNADILELKKEYVLRLENSPFKDKGAENFSLKKTLEHLGFIRKQIDYRGPLYRVEIWQLQYPISTNIYEKYILPSITDRYSFGHFIRQNTGGRAGLCYFDLSRLMWKIAPGSERIYPKLEYGHIFAGEPMLASSILTFAP